MGSEMEGEGVMGLQRLSQLKRTAVLVVGRESDIVDGKTGLREERIELCLVVDDG